MHIEKNLNKNIYPKYQNRLRTVEECKKFLMDQYNNYQNPYFVTLQINDYKTQKLSTYTLDRRDQLSEKLNSFDKTLAHYSIGRNYWKPHNAGKRPVGIGVYEKFETNPHFHLIVDFRACSDIELNVAEAWKKVCPSGTTNVQKIYNVQGVIDYCSKELNLALLSNHEPPLVSLDGQI